MAEEPRYKTPSALERAMKDAARNSRLNTSAAIDGFYRQRLLARLFEGSSPFILKGGQAMLARDGRSRTSRDIDVTTSSLLIEPALDELMSRAGRDMGDYLAFRPIARHPIRTEDEYREGYTLTFEVFIGPKKVQNIALDLVADEVDKIGYDVLWPDDLLEVKGLEYFAYKVYSASKAVADKLCVLAQC